MPVARILGLFSLVVLGCGAPFPPDTDVVAPLGPPPTPGTDSVPGPPPTDVTRTNAAPNAIIISPLPNTVVVPGVTLTLKGVLSDQDHVAASLTGRWQTLGGALIEDVLPDDDGVVEASYTVPQDGVDGVTLIATDPAGAKGSASSAVIGNTPPGPVTVTLFPDLPTSEDDLLAIVTLDADDPDRDESGIAYVYQWYVDGELAGIEGSLVDASLTRAGETWRVTARAYDGFELGPISEVEVDIALAAPSVFVDAPLGADGDLMCAIDQEGSLPEAEEVRWFWSVGDDAELETTQNLGPDAVHHCDVVTCRVEISLGDDAVSSPSASAQLPYGEDCENDSPCLEKACVDSGGCSALPAVGPCDDGDPCTQDDVCVDGVCASGAAVVCEVVSNATSGCVEGLCALTCDEGWQDCDGDPSNGCEFEDVAAEGCDA